MHRSTSKRPDGGGNKVENREGQPMEVKGKITILSLVEEIIKLEESALSLLGGMTDESFSNSSTNATSTSTSICGSRFTILRNSLLTIRRKIQDINTYLERLNKQFG